MKKNFIPHQMDPGTNKKRKMNGEERDGKSNAPPSAPPSPPPPPPPPPAQKKKDKMGQKGTVYEVRFPNEEIRNDDAPSLVAVTEKNNMTAAWKYISERLEDPFPENSPQFSNATTRYKKGVSGVSGVNILNPAQRRSCLIIPNVFNPPYKEWVGNFQSRNSLRFMFIRDVSAKTFSPFD